MTTKDSEAMWKICIPPLDCLLEFAKPTPTPTPHSHTSPSLTPLLHQLGVLFFTGSNEKQRKACRSPVSPGHTLQKHAQYLLMALEKAVKVQPVLFPGNLRGRCGTGSEVRWEKQV